MIKCLTAALFYLSFSSLGPLSAQAVDPSTTDPGAPVKTTLANGLRIIVKPETDTQLIAIDVFVRAGAPQETASTAGIGSFVAQTLFASTTNSPPETMTRDINALGGNVAAAWHTDWTQIGALTVKDKYADAIFLLADTLKNADFDPGVVADTRTQILNAIDSRDSDLFQISYGNLQKALYRGTSYARPEGGTAGNISRLTHADLLGYYARYYVPKNLVFVIVGNITAKDAVREIKNDLDDFQRADRAAAPFSDPLPPLSTDLPPLRIFQPDLEQECVVAGVRAASVSDPDSPALMVANALLGGMKSGRLFTQLREKQGLAYDLGSLYNPRLAAGDIAAYVYAAPTKTDPTTKKEVPTVGLVKSEILKQFASFQAAPPTPAELARAQHYLIGSYKIKHERIEDRASLLGAAELSSRDGYLLDTQYARSINAVTAADVQRVAVKYFAHPVVSTVEPDTKE